MGDPGIEATLARLEAAKMRWTMGGAAEGSPNGLAAGKTGPEAQLRLLAEAAMIRPATLRPVAPSLTVADPLPELPLHPLQGNARAAFRRILAAKQTQLLPPVLHLMARRGWMAHPLDWMPPRQTDDLPEAYVSLADWAQSRKRADAVELTDETWDDLAPETRRALFSKLRLEQPDAARDILANRLSTMRAEERLTFVTRLADRLSDTDRPVLEGLVQSDKSGKVQAQAAVLLARMGVASPTGDAVELAGFFQRGKTGLLRRRDAILPATKLNNVQIARIDTLFELVTLPALAAAFEMDAPALIAAWPTDHNRFTDAFSDLVARSAADAEVAAWWTRLTAEKAADLRRFEPLAPRLAAADRARELARLVSRSDHLALAYVTRITGGGLDAATSAAVLSNPSVKAELRRGLTALTTPPGDKPDRDQLSAARIVTDLLTELGILLTADDARRVLDQAQAAGLHLADPRLTLLNFNHSLNEAPA